MSKDEGREGYENDDFVAMWDAAFVVWGISMGLYGMY